MSKGILDNLKMAKWTLAILFGGLYLQKRIGDKQLKQYVFGEDGKLFKILIRKYLGNGGDMLRIWTFLTDQEITYLKALRRQNWHAIQTGPNSISSSQSTITDQELADKGINLPREPYVEYNKRPPHDFYL
jgi:hypothetical protein